MCAKISECCCDEVKHGVLLNSVDDFVESGYLLKEVFNSPSPTESADKVIEPIMRTTFAEARLISRILAKNATNYQS